MNRITYHRWSGASDRAHAAQRQHHRGLQVTIFYSDAQSAVKLIERQARRLWSAEARVTAACPERKPDVDVGLSALLVEQA